MALSRSDLNTEIGIKLATNSTIRAAEHRDVLSELLDYVDAADLTKLPLAGGTMTGNISFVAGQPWPTFNQNTTGNAATATRLSSDRTNYVQAGTTNSVVGQLSWRNYGNNHTIFDVSSGTTLNGTSVSNVNPQVVWSPSHPTLMGWNGSNTYGVRVDSARNSDTLSGLPIHTGVNNEINKIVRTDNTGYLYTGWINTISGDNGTTPIDRVYASNDGFLRYYTPSNFRQVLNVPTRTGGNASGTWGIDISGNANYASSAGSATTAGSAGDSALLGGQTLAQVRDYWKVSDFSGKTAYSSALNITDPLRQSFQRGYTHFRSGLFIQWGWFAGNNIVTPQITFPVAFDQIPSVTISGIRAGRGASGANYVWNVNPAGFTPTTDSDFSQWIAVGFLGGPLEDPVNP